MTCGLSLTPNPFDVKLSCTTPLSGNGVGVCNCSEGTTGCKRVLVGVSPLTVIGGMTGALIDELQGNDAGAELALSVNVTVKENGP